MSLRIALTLTLASAAVLVTGCGGGDTGSSGGGGASGTMSGETTASGHGAGTGTSASSSMSSSGGGGSGGSGTSVCPAEIQPVDTSAATNKVGSGTAASCTEQALAAAVTTGGAIVFDCGGPATITLTSQIELPKGIDTTIDGGGSITIDGGGATRLFHWDAMNYRVTTTVYTFQHLTLQNGKSTGPTLPHEDPPCSNGYDYEAGGGAIYVADGILHVIDVTFLNNAAAVPGPDVGGGGIYAAGSLGVVVVKSTFHHNTGSDAGAIGSLNSDLTLIDDVFDDNHALGTDANSVNHMTCGSMSGEIGNGGNGGAVGIDGGDDGTVAICTSQFTNNSAHAFGGAIGRTPDGAMMQTNIDRCTFDGNSTDDVDMIGGGGAMYFHNSALTITNSTISNNTAPGAGAIQADGTNLVLVNDTFTGNSATAGLGGTIAIFSNGGSIQNCTFADNHADGGSGLFGAALAGGQTFTVDNSIFQNNTSMDCGAPMACAITGTGQADLQWPSAHIVCSSADTPCGGAAGTQFADAKLGMLAANGGPTKTILPAADSPAKGIGKSCPPTDQRGNPRPMNGCTAGAVELP